MHIIGVLDWVRHKMLTTIKHLIIKWISRLMFIVLTSNNSRYDSMKLVASIIIYDDNESMIPPTMFCAVDLRGVFFSVDNRCSNSMINTG